MKALAIIGEVVLSIVFTVFAITCTGKTSQTNPPPAASSTETPASNLKKVGEGLFGPNAHSVAVDSRTHLIYFPLQNVGGKPVLRIALPSDKHL